MHLGVGEPSESLELVDLAAQTAQTVQTQDVTSQKPKLTPCEDEERKEAEETHHGIRLILVLLCLFLGNFTIGFDSSCIATLVVVLTDQFHALDDVGWYQTTYILTLCAPLLIMGKLYSDYSMKTLYMISFAVFVAGSILTAAAPTSTAFILGRAVSGLGASGINAGMYIIIARITSPETLPIVFGICGGVECVALAFGPLVSGTIAHYATWRVNFWIIVGLGSAVGVGMFFSMKPLTQSEKSGLRQRLQRIDWRGLAVQVPMTVCLVLALQWGGGAYPWSNWRIILLLTLAGVLITSFLVVEHYGGEKSMLALSMLRQRTVALSCLVGFCNFSALWLLTNYLPIYFQAVRGANAFGSGLMYLPTTLSMAMCALLGGPFTSRVGRYNPTLLFGGVMSVIGAALLTRFGPETSRGRWIGYQIVYGIGNGLAFQPPAIAIQTVLDRAMVPVGLVLLNFVQILGAIACLSIAQNIFLAQVRDQLVRNIPHFDTGLLSSSGVGDLAASVPAQYRQQVTSAYSSAIVDVFYIGLALICVGLLLSFGLEWKPIKSEEKSE